MSCETCEDRTCNSCSNKIRQKIFIGDIVSLNDDNEVIKWEGSGRKEYGEVIGFCYFPVGTCVYVQKTDSHTTVVCKVAKEFTL